MREFLTMLSEALGALIVVSAPFAVSLMLWAFYG